MNWWTILSRAPTIFIIRRKITVYNTVDTCMLYQCTICSQNIADTVRLHHVSLSVEHVGQWARTCRSRKGSHQEHTLPPETVFSMSK